MTGTEVRFGGRVLAVLLGVVFVAFGAQQVLNPVLAPLSRELRLTEVQLGLVITVAALVFAAGSLFWGRVADAWGQRRLLLTGLTICTLGLVGFAVVCRVALDGGWATGSVLAAMIATRSLLFGLGAGAVSVAALAYAGIATSGERERTRAVSLIGAAQAASLTLGPGLGGLAAAGELLLPVYAAPVLLLVGLVAAAVLLPRPPRGAAAPAGRGGASVRPWDARVRPFLGVGFLLFLSIGVMQVVLGFLFQDRLALGAQDTAVVTGAGGFVTGAVVLLTQAVLVPRLGWGPARLLRTGAPIGVVGFVVLALAPGFWTMLVGLVVLALGVALGMPGFTAGPGLRLGPDEQGAAAGLVNATMGATFVVGPLAGTALYGVAPALPIWVCALCCALAAGVAWTNRAIPATAEPSTGTAGAPGSPAATGSPAAPDAPGGVGDDPR